MTDNTSAPPLDLDAITKRARLAVPPPWGTDDEAVVCFAPSDNRPELGEYTVAHVGDRDDREFIAHAREDVPDLLARVRVLTAKLDATAQAFDDLVAQVWRATGETHEPPADVAALLRRVAEEHKALVGFRRAMLDVHEALDGVRPEPDFDMPAELGSYACDEVARLKAAVLPAGHVAVDRALYEAACRLAADVPRLQREVAAARREGAEAMREACADICDTRAVDRGSDELQYAARALRALPLPGGEP